MFLGDYDLGDTVYFPIDTHDISGVESDADLLPTFRVYEEATQLPILTGSSSLFDDGSTIGCYQGNIVVSAGNGFDAGKQYRIRIRAVVGGNYANYSHTFKIRIEAIAIESSVQTLQGSVNTLSSNIGAVTEYTADSMSIVFGNQIAGDLTSVQTANDVRLQIEEDVTNGIELTFDFDNTDHEETPNSVKVLGRYTGGGTHYIEAYAYNYDAGSWELISTVDDVMTNTSQDFIYTWPLTNKHVNDADGKMRVRLKHVITSYNTNHDLFIDKISVNKYHLMDEASINEAIEAGIVGTGVTSIESKVDVIDNIVDALTLNLSKSMGLTLHNHVEDSIVRNADNLKTQSKLYIYNNKANATIHDKSTGLITSYTLTASYDNEKRLTQFKVVED